jgi:hypothetical protein
MELIFGAIFYTLGQGLAFNVILPIWALVLEFQGLWG